MGWTIFFFMEVIIKQLPQRAKDVKKGTKKYFRKLAKQKPKSLDSTISELHDEVFEAIDCLACANCCKTTSPIFRDIDIERIARHLRIRPAKLVEDYLHLDGDGDYVLNSSPCTFLDAENYCSIYEVRPKACREYPHTDRKDFHQILDLTMKNISVCPATFEIIQRLQKALPM